MEHMPVANTEAVSSEEKLKQGIESADRQWRLIIEAVSQEAKTSPEVRQALIAAAKEPIGEGLAETVLDQLQAVSPRIASLVERYRDSLGSLLAEPAIAEDRIVPDLQNATLSREERLRAENRFRYARDIKLLGLMSAFIDEPLEPENRTPEGEYLTSQNIKVFAEGRDAEETRRLMDASKWERRRQLKDRVYEIIVEGRRYILKEQKTRYHSHQPRGGHRSPVSSREEFQSAKDLYENGTLATADRVAVTWERPLGYVEFPDGYQFAVFEFSSHASTRDPADEYYGDSQEIIRRLKDAILSNKQVFEAEYQRIAELAETSYIHEEGIEFYPAPIKDRALLRAVQVIRKPEMRPVRLSFEDFATIKALRMRERVSELMRNIEWQRGYLNEDHDGYALYLSSKDGPWLTAVGFDFEYLKRPKDLPERAENFLEALRESLELESQRARNRHNDIMLHVHGGPASRIQAATYRALLAQEMDLG